MRGLFDKPKKKRLRVGQRVRYTTPPTSKPGVVLERCRKGLYMIRLDASLREGVQVTRPFLFSTDGGVHKINCRLSPGERIVYAVPERVYVGVVEERPGKGIYLVRLDDPACLAQAKRGELHKIK